MPEQNRNGHLSKFEDYLPIPMTIDEIVARAVAMKNGDQDAFLEPPETVVASFETVDLVRYRLNSAALSDAFAAIGMRQMNCHDDMGYANRSARFGVVDRASGEPVALFWILGSDTKKNEYNIANASFSQSRTVAKEEMLAVLNELDVPARRNNGDDIKIIDNYDLWHDGDQWILKEPQYLAVFKYESICFSTVPAMRDTISVHVPIDPNLPLDGSGDAYAAYAAKDHYKGLADRKFWATPHHVQPGYSSWMGFGEPIVVKAASRDFYPISEETTALNSSGITPKS